MSSTSNEPKDNQATKIVELATLHGQVFRSPESGTFMEDRGFRGAAMAMRTTGFRDWLGRLYFKKYGTSPGHKAVEEALSTLRGMALYDGASREVFVRKGEHQGKIYIDLCGDKYQWVEISPAGWQVVSETPIPFIRTRGMLPLPAPERGGNLDDLRPFVNIEGETDWILFISWLVGTFSAGPFPPVAINGQHGSAKSTTSKIAKELIDPNQAPIRTRPRDERDLMISAKNNLLLAYDNLSSIPDWLSDAFCRLATGAGQSVRQNYTDEDEVIFQAKRPLILNGIAELASRGDLMDRSIILTTPKLETVKPESEFWSEFYQARPKILGALYDVIAGTLFNLPLTNLTKYPRMADFARWAVAAEPVLTFPDGSFLKAYTENRKGANVTVLEDSYLYSSIIQLLNTQQDKTYKGTAAYLKELLENQSTGKRQEAFAKMKPHTLSGELRRLVPNLEMENIKVEFHKPERNKITKKTEREITIKIQDELQEDPIQESFPL